LKMKLQPPPLLEKLTKDYFAEQEDTRKFVKRFWEGAIKEDDLLVSFNYMYTEQNNKGRWKIKTESVKAGDDAWLDKLVTVQNENKLISMTVESRLVCKCVDTTNAQQFHIEFEQNVVKKVINIPSVQRGDELYQFNDTRTTESDLKTKFDAARNSPFKMYFKRRDNFVRQSKHIIIHLGAKKYRFLMNGKITRDCFDEIDQKLFDKSHQA